MTTLFDPLTLGPLSLPHRVVMAPMTRSRSAQPGNVPWELNAEYYAQRSTAALIVSEATQISPMGQGYSFTPGLYTAEQIAGWRLVTEAVHARGGRMFAQLWHVGRMSHESFHAGKPPVAPSALSSGARVWISTDGRGTMVPTTRPRSLEIHEIPEIVEDYRRAAAAAMEAGFDGVEIHGANGYLIDQFLRTTSNTRSDEYGGAIEGRVRFALEVVQAVSSQIGAERVGIRVSPQIKARNMDCPEIERTILELVRRLDNVGIAYVHLAEADWDDAPTIPVTFRRQLREAFSGRIIVAGGYTPESAESILVAGYADLVAFGRPFIANPDYPERVATDAPLAGIDADTLYGGGAVGYTDYPTMADDRSVPTPHESEVSMRAVSVGAHGAPDELTDIELPVPMPGPRDLLVEVRAVSVNPVDTKVRASGGTEGEPRVLGYDAVGTVRSVGAEVTLFARGDDVFYAGSIARPGTNAQFHVVDERIVGRKPARLSDEEAAAVPLTAITAWELLFHRLGIVRGGGAGKRLLIAGASGGVGSMLVQIASSLTQLEVVATASRPDSQEWVRTLGADRVIDHTHLANELSKLGPVDYIASLTGTDRNFAVFADAIAPQGSIAIIDDPSELDIVPLKSKSVSVHWELMFTRPLFDTSDVQEQHALLDEVSALLDAGQLRTTLTRSLSPINAESLTEAHRLVEVGGVPGKVVVSGWE